MKTSRNESGERGVKRPPRLRRPRLSRPAWRGDTTCGRGHLGQAYVLPPTLAASAVLEIRRLNDVECRHVAGVSFELVRSIHSTSTVSLERFIFVIEGWEFWFMFDRAKASVLIPHDLGKKLGFERFSDDELSSIVRSSEKCFSEWQVALRQVWLYASVKIHAATAPLNPTELALQERCRRQAVPFPEVYANLVAGVLFENEDCLDELFQQAWRIYADFACDFSDDLSHLNAEALSECRQLRMSRMHSRIGDCEFFTRVGEKKHLAAVILQRFREDRVSAPDALTVDPTTAASHLFSFIAMLRRPVMDRFASQAHDEFLESAPECLDDADAGQTLNLTFCDPTLSLVNHLQSDRGSSILLLGAPVGWQYRPEIRQLVGSLMSEVSDCQLFVAETMKESIPLYPEFCLTRTHYVRPGRNEHLSPVDNESLLNQLASLGDRSAIVMASCEQASRTPLINVDGVLVKDVERLPVQVHTACLMDARYGGDCSLLRGRKNGLVHAMSGRHGLFCLDVDKNQSLKTIPVLPGNNHRNVTFGQSWDSVLFLAYNPDGDRDDDSQIPTPDSLLANTQPVGNVTCG